MRAKTVFTWCRRPLFALALFSAWSLALACSQSSTRSLERFSAGVQPAAGARSFTILAINDVYRIAGLDDGGGLARLRTLRRQLEREHPDLLMLHAGDFLSPSLLSRRYYGAQMIDVMNLLDGDAYGFDPRLIVTFGNHEFDRGRAENAEQLDLRIAQSDFRWLTSNIVFGKSGDGEPLIAGDNLVRSLLIESGGVRVGLFGLTIDSQNAAFIDHFADPVEVAREATTALRNQGAEVVVALTHLRESDDVQILETLGDQGPDLIIGGHEHERLSRTVAGRMVIKADADAKTASVVTVTPKASGAPEVHFRYVHLDQRFEPDPRVAKRVKQWLDWFDEAFCTHLDPPEPLGCIDITLGRAGVKLVAEELQIRRFETNLGDWIADQALAAFADRGAQIALLNAGSMRLNQDIPAGTSITRRQLEALLPFSAKLELLRIRGSVLQEAIEHAILNWTGNGHWPQIAGFAFRHDPATGTADRLTLLGADGPRPVDPDEEILLVTSEFLADASRGQDGYTMFEERFKIETDGVVDLKQKVGEALGAAGAAGIKPQRAGRICTVGYAGHDDPCLAVAR